MAQDRVKMIEDLLLAKQLFSGRFERLWAELESHRIAERADAQGVERDGCRMSPQRIATVWTWLNRHSNDQLRSWA
jgi:hypothetical protein